MTVAIVGLGKIGLPLGVAIAGSGTPVVGLDISEDVVATINGGGAPFPGEPHLEDRLRTCLDVGSLRATTDADDAISGADTVIVVVPLVVDPGGRPDFAVMDAATATVGPRLRPGTLVSYETTLPVGATRGRFAPRLAELSGLRLGEDLFVCHSPERVSSGRVFADLTRYPKLVGGIDAASEERAVAFYASVLQFDPRDDLPRPNGVWPMAGAEAAEMAKLAETTYRDVNIGFANELALAAERVGVDVFRIVEACNSQPFSHLHLPGVSVGGHCIPVYPHLLMDSVPGFTIPAVARDANLRMPEHAVSAVDAAVPGGIRGRRVVILGLAYRGGVKEDAFSGTYGLDDVLRQRGAEVLVHDPLYSDEELTARGFAPFHYGQAADAAILHTDHDEYRHLEPHRLPGVEVIYDGRNLLPESSFRPEQVIRLGRPSG